MFYWGVFGAGFSGRFKGGTRRAEVKGGTPGGWEEEGGIIGGHEVKLTDAFGAFALLVGDRIRRLRGGSQGGGIYSLTPLTATSL